MKSGGAVGRVGEGGFRKFDHYRSANLVERKFDHHRAESLTIIVQVGLWDESDKEEFANLTIIVQPKAMGDEKLRDDFERTLCTQAPLPTESVYRVVLPKSIPSQIRQPILYIGDNQG